MTFSYTPVGLQQQMTDASGTSNYTYDSLNRLTKAVNGANQEVDYGYDLASNLTSLTYPAIGTGSAVTVTRKYDAANRLTDVIDWTNNDTKFGYDADSNLSSETLPTSNATTSTFSYDTADQLKKIVTARTAGSNPFRWTFGYGRDPLGQVSATTDRMEGIRHTYGYDALNRLTSDTRSNRTSTSWTYDAADNLKSQVDTGSGLTKTFSYNSTNSELTGLQLSGSSSQSLSFGYNANGDRINASGGANPITYGYNQADELTSYLNGSNPNYTYTYDGDGLRTSKKVYGAAEQYTWDVAEGLPLIIQDGTTRYLTGPDGVPIEQVDATGTVQYYVQDDLGSTRGLLDTAGNVVGTYTFTPFGELKGHGGTASTPFQYAGQYTDNESGLQYLRARYYDPSTAQFLTIDPALSQTMEPYGYAAGDPLNTVDPTGLCSSCAGSTPSPCMGHSSGQTSLLSPQMSVESGKRGGRGRPHQLKKKPRYMKQPKNQKRKPTPTRTTVPIPAPKKGFACFINCMSERVGAEDLEGQWTSCWECAKGPWNPLACLECSARSIITAAVAVACYHQCR